MTDATIQDVHPDPDDVHLDADDVHDAADEMMEDLERMVEDLHRETRESEERGGYRGYEKQNGRKKK